MVLEEINSPEALRKLKVEELPKLASLVRQRMVEVVSVNGGHLASSLGAVELIIALHYCFNTPFDKIIFDVGHQSYAHKILTGRSANFSSLRQFSGISGFPSKDESEFDVFTTGHSSNAVSLSLGLACAREHLNPAQNYKVAAVIGDGSLSGGLCFEGLNNAGHLKKDILVVLNTNEMSIAPNVGAISNYLNKIISLPVYNHFRESLTRFLSSRGPRGERLLKLANRFEEGLKGLFVPGVLFEEMGFRYFGPLEGNNLELLIPALKNIINIKGPRILHVVTKKGKGYFAAEKEPVRFHGTGPFELQTGEPLAAKDGQKSFTDVFGEKLVKLAENNKRIVAITAAMPEGTGLDKIRQVFPERFFDVGIAEGHAVSFSAGLAKAGLKPVVAIYSTFLQRAYDQIIEDVALQNLPVVFCVDRAGIVGEDGVTHQGIFDLSFLNTVPDLIIMAPKDSDEFEEMLDFAVAAERAVAIRYPRSKVFNLGLGQKNTTLSLGKAETLIKGEGFAVIALGAMVGPSLEALNILKSEGFSGELINARFAKPLDVELFREIAKRFKYIFTVEESILTGGFGSAVEDSIAAPVFKIGLPCKFVPHGKRDILLEKYGLSGNKIAEKIRSQICRR